MADRVVSSFCIGKHIYMRGYTECMIQIIRESPTDRLDLNILMISKVISVPQITKECAIEHIERLCAEIDGWDCDMKQAFVDDYLTTGREN